MFLVSVGALLALSWLGAKIGAGSGSLQSPLVQPLAIRILQESFALLAALCFVTMSWQYNARLLTQGLLIAAGVSLIARAALPLRPQDL